MVGNIVLETRRETDTIFLMSKVRRKVPPSPTQERHEILQKINTIWNNRFLSCLLILHPK
jgi:hypothetical protein